MAGAELSNNLNRSGTMTKIECAVCLQTSVHPAELPCGHIFCYLCIKGIVNQGRRCAMCRQDIPVDYLDKPKLLNPMDAEVISQGFEDGHVWFYEGHNGWWQYDERSSLELECAYQKGERCCDLLIAGFLYVADFDGMLQYRRNDPSRRRRIKRDLATTSKKGIAGLKSTKTLNSAPSSSHEVVSSELIQNLPASSSSSLTSLGGVRIFNSASNNSGQQIDQRQTRMPQNSSGGLSEYPTSICRPINSTNSNPVSQMDNSSTNFRTLNLDNVLHDSLDWTIEQIQSLDLELLNDYEALFRDVSSYGQLQDSLSQSRPRRLPHSHMNRYLNVSNPPSQSHDNDLDTSIGVTSLPSSSVSDFPTSEDSNPLHSEAGEVLPYLQVRGASPAQPPPRIRGIFKSGSKINSLRHPSNS